MIQVKEDPDPKQEPQVKAGTSRENKSKTVTAKTTPTVKREMPVTDSFN
jgi:hypothetical protein